MDIDTVQEDPAAMTIQQWMKGCREFWFNGRRRLYTPLAPKECDAKAARAYWRRMNTLAGNYDAVKASMDYHGTGE